MYQRGTIVLKNIFYHKWGTHRDASKTQSANEFFSWEHLKMCSGVLWPHFGTSGAESWGG